MTKSQVIQSKIACWLAVGGFTGASTLTGWNLCQFFAEASRPGVFMCGNSVIDPLGAILGFGTPVGLAGAIGLAVLARRGLASWWSAVGAALLALGCTVGFLVFGFQFCRDSLPGFHLSNIVWWLRPLGV
jgi:hypothetical protein